MGLAEGHGYARLLRHDTARQAMLQERLGAPLAELGLPVTTQIQIICATLQRAWRRLPPASANLPLREWSGELLQGEPVRLGRERCELLGHLTGVDTQAIWEWGFVERVSTGLLAMQVGMEDVGRRMLEVAGRWVQP